MAEASRETADRGAAPLALRVLGPLEAAIGGRAVELGGARQRAVFAVLLIEPNRVVSSERIIELIWGDERSDKTVGTLQVYISNLRRLLEPAATARGRPVIVTRRPGYLVDLDGDELDLVQLRALIEAAETATRSSAHMESVQALRAALSLYRGPVLGDVDVALEPVAAPLDALRLSLLSRIAVAELAAGRHREVVAELREWSSENPFDESLRAQLMVALYRCGRQTEALREYENARQLLGRQLGIEPSPELRALEAAILAQDPSLDAPAAGGGRQRPVGFDDATELRSTAEPPTGFLELAHRVVPLDRPVVTLGRHPERHVVVLDPRASRLHAEIRREMDGFQLVDAGSANGTLLNGETVETAWLEDGDVVQIGDTELVYREGMPPQR